MKILGHSSPAQNHDKQNRKVNKIDSGEERDRSSDSNSESDNKTPPNRPRGVYKKDTIYYKPTADGKFICLETKVGNSTITIVLGTISKIMTVCNVLVILLVYRHVKFSMFN